MHANAPRTPTNGDGFGLGWYTKQPFPGLFRSIRPAWNDNNLRDLTTHIESPMFLAHVRATSLATIQETNCHPFRYKNWLFVHNGQIAQFAKLKQKLLCGILPEYFDNIQGSTDSEVMFHLALSLGLEKDVPGAIGRMVRLVEDAARAEGITEAIWMTLGITDGESLWGFRYGSDGKGPTLYISPNIEELLILNPEIDGLFGDFAVCLVSEPIGNFMEAWRPLPENSLVVVNQQQHTIEVSAFEP
jgi:glutamine amidotransferase